MRKVFKDFDAIPAILQGNACQQLIAVSLVEKGSHAFKTDIYGHQDVRKSLDKIYLSKCAFCETDTSAGATLQVEHYRPKAKVTGEPTHPGYYWLGYQWSNLLLACSSCNNTKRNKFPVAVQRTDKPPLKPDGTLDTQRCRADDAVLVGEWPLLINPEIEDNPMLHFLFQADGTMEHKTDHGKSSIDTCNLNRDRLVVWRKKVYDNVFNPLLRRFGDYKNGQITEEQLVVSLTHVIIDNLVDYINNDENQYLEFAKTCWREFENFFTARFQPEEQKHLIKAHAYLLRIMADVQ